jgi:hypothetical protein
MYERARISAPKTCSLHVKFLHFFLGVKNIFKSPDNAMEAGKNVKTNNRLLV